MNDGKIVFDLPIYAAQLYHSQRGATNPWMRAFNVIEVGDMKVDLREALKTARSLFEADGLNIVTVYAVVIEKLEVPEGGDVNGGD